MMNNIAFVFCTCDSYDDIWNPFFVQFKKNWPEMNLPIYLCTETKTFNFEGYDIRCPLSVVNEDLSTWSKCLIRLLQLIPEDYIILSLDDFFLTKPVIHDIVEKSVSFMQNDSKIGFICLHQELTENSNAQRKNNAIPAEIPELHQCLKGFPYRITTQTGIWRKSFLLKLLKPFESAWQFEVRANRRMNWYYDKYKIYDVNDAIVDYPSGGVVWRGKYLKEYINMFDKKLTTPIIEKRGFITKEQIGNMPKRKKHLKDYICYFLSLLP